MNFGGLIRGRLVYTVKPVYKDHSTVKPVYKGHSTVKPVYKDLIREELLYKEKYWNKYCLKIVWLLYFTGVFLCYIHQIVNNSKFNNSWKFNYVIYVLYINTNSWLFWEWLQLLVQKICNKRITFKICCKLLWTLGYISRKILTIFCFKPHNFQTIFVPIFFFVQ
jgi:hypothetical protein